MSRKPELFFDAGAVHAKMTEFVLSRRNDDVDYALVMKVGEGYSFHYRLGQPCYGELRKYQLTHGTLCTRPESEKPDDLFWPFPEGVPYAVAVPFYNSKRSDSRDNYLRALVNADSPWISGFGSPEDVEFLEKEGHLTGFILKNMHVDPTVMVHLIWATCYVQGAEGYDKLLADGFSSKEALAILVMNSAWNPYSQICEQNDYNFGSRLSLKRFFGQRPRDFSGGKFDEGYDYNRRMIQDIFYSDTGLEWKEAVIEGGMPNTGWGPIGVNAGNRDKLIPAMQFALKKGLHEEQDIVDKPFETRAPVMNPGDVFMIDVGWGNYETGEYSDEDRDDYDPYDDDDCGDPECTICHPKAASK